MKTAVKIFALILAAALCAGLFSCASVPTPLPAVTDTDAAETAGVPDTTGVPETDVVTTVPDTSAPETKAPETTNVPDTTPSLTTAPVTTVPETIVPETTAAETENSTSFPISPFAESYYKESPSGVKEPFYWINESQIGVRGFDGVVLSVADGCYLSFDPSILEGLPFDIRRTVRFSFTEKPDLPQDQTGFWEQIDWGTAILHLSDSCSLRVVCHGLFHHEYNGQTDECLFLIKHPEASHFYLPILKSEDGRNVRYLQASLYSEYHMKWIAFDIMDATLNDKLDKVAGLRRTFQFRDIGSCAGVCFNGEYGLFLVDHVPKTLFEEKNPKSYYSLYATNDSGSTWVRFDPGDENTPEFVLKYLQKGGSTVIEKRKTD